MEIGPDWQRFSATFTIPDDAASDMAYVGVGTTGDAIVDIDAISVVAGEQTEYTQTDAQSIGLDADLPPHRTYMLGSGGLLPVKVTNTG